MDINTFQEIINGWDIWLSVFIMILIVVLQSAFFLKTAIKEAKTIGISGEKRKAAMRAACITAIGPSMSPVIMMLAMSTVLGSDGCQYWNTCLDVWHLGWCAQQCRMVDSCVFAEP